MTAVTKSSPRIPGPAALGVVGDYARYIGLFASPLRAMRQYYKTYGEICSPTGEMNEDRKGMILAFGSQYNQQLLSDPSIFYSPDLGGKPGSTIEQLGTGLVMENGERHRKHRRLVMPAFHKKYIESYRDDMVALTERMLAGWQTGTIRDLRGDIHHLALEIANTTLFGLDTLEENLGGLMGEWLSLTVHPMGRIFPFDLPGFPYRRLVRFSDLVVEKVRAVIARKRANPGGSDVLSTMIATHDEDGSALSDEELVGQTNILFIAGHETSANTMMWALFFLAQYPKLLADVVDECDGVLHGNAPTVQQVGQLPLLERVIKETLRLMPPLTWQVRIAQEAFEIGPYHRPAGSSVMYSHFMTHRIAPVFEQPDRFMPERWETINPSPYEYIPFSGGPRLCIGATFAMMEMKIVLPMILQRFGLALLPNTKIDYQALPTLSVKKTLPIMLHPRGATPETHRPLGTINELIEW
ncbi:MAG: cytochrome P450 [Anaerolineae bacterium]